MLKLIALASAALLSVAAQGSTAVHHTTVVKVIEKDGKTTRTVEVDGHPSRITAAMSNCSGRRFETSAETQKNGKKQVQKILLCSKSGEGKAQWAKSLESALSRVQSNSGLSPESRGKLAAALRAEIGRVKAGR